MATDGSEASNACFDLTADGLMQQGDSVKVGHIHNSSKDYLPKTFHLESIKARYEGLLTRYDNSGFFSEHLREGGSTKEQIQTMASTLKADCIVIGFHGRKGPKADPTLMGSAVSHLGLKAECPVIIVKDK